MRKTFILFSILMLVVFTAQAQRGQRLSSEERAENTANEWQEEFGLSDEQYEKVYDLVLENTESMQEKMQEIRASGDRSGMREAFEELQEELDEELKKVFSKAQWTKFEKWKEDRAQRGRRGGGRGGL